MNRSRLRLRKQEMGTRLVMRMNEMITKDEMSSRCWTNSLKQYHLKCMKNNVQKMHVDIEA